MKKIALLAMFLLMVCGSFAQKNKKEVIYLKNGSVLKGQLVPLDNDQVAVRSGPNIWVFNVADIDTVNSKRLSQPMEEAPERNYFLKTTFGVLAGSTDNMKATPFSFDASFNYQFYSKFYAGLGAGIDLLEESYMPVFLNLEYHFRNSRFTPYVGFQGGYLVPVDGRVNMQGNYYYDILPYSSYWPSYEQMTLDNQGGMMFNPAFGFVSHINENLGISLAFGYRYSQVIFKGAENYEYETNYNRLSIRLGIIFN